MRKNNMFMAILAVMLLAGATYLVYSHNQSTKIPQEKIDAFAQCLAAKGLTMYGAVWCPHCQKQKALFGPSFKYIPYVECPDNTKLCLDKGIQGYPTWMLPDGTKYEGEQSFVKLAEVTSCPVPVSGL